MSVGLSSRLFLAASILIGSVAHAERVNQRESWGLGLMLGSPIGISVKYWMGGSDALDFGLGAGPGFRIHGDYDWGLAQLLRNKSDLTLDLYLGLGGALVFGSGYCGWYDGRFCADRLVFGGVRVPFGIEARLRRAPVTFGLELAPGVLFGSYVEGLFDAFLFVRYVLP
jgi:hypothetical protein